MEFENNLPIYLQVVEEIKRLLLNGELKTGEKLWSARDMAIRYKINPNTAARVYKELEQEELCFTKRGMGTYLTEDKTAVERLRRERAEALCTNFVKGFQNLGFSSEEMRVYFEQAVTAICEEE